MPSLPSLRKAEALAAEEASRGASAKGVAHTLLLLLRSGERGAHEKREKPLALPRGVGGGSGAHE